MNTEHIKRLEMLTGRQLNAGEVARLGRIQSVLNLTDNDALWDVLTALEYQRVYYEALPVKITAATKELLQGMNAGARDPSTANILRGVKPLAFFRCGSA